MTRRYNTSGMSSSALPDHPSSEPDSSLTHQKIRQVAHRLARLLDATWIIPGTHIKIGLDPLLGLIPGIGDLISNAVGSLLLFLATKAGVPRIVIVRMAMNVCINMAMGAIPGVGDVLSIWFKSNLRNAQLLDRHCRSGHRPVPLGDWVYVGSILGFLLALMVGILGGLVWALFFVMEALRALPD